jgi:hypothetical protein
VSDAYDRLTPVLDCQDGLLCVAHYKTFHIGWTGWKVSERGSSTVASQWIASRPRTNTFLFRGAKVGGDQLLEAGFTQRQEPDGIRFEHSRLCAIEREKALKQLLDDIDADYDD